MKTKDRILITARTLFNQHGYGNVKIADIAKSMGISSGNIWYHFNNRKDMHAEITRQFISEAASRMMIRPSSGSAVYEFAELSYVLAQEVSKYRFLYRDQAEYGVHTEQTQTALPKLHKGTLNQYIAFITEIREQGAIAVKKKEIHALAENLCILLRYSPEFLRESTLSFGTEHEDEKHSFGLQCFILERFMTPNASEQFRSTLFSLLKKHP